MRCIGGPNDGEWHEISNRRIGDSVKIYDYPKRVSFKVPTNIDEAIDYVSVKVSIYRIAVFNFSKDDRYYFLVPEGQTDKAAIKYQMERKILKEYTATELHDELKIRIKNGEIPNDK